MKITLERNPAEKIAAGALIVPVFEGEKEPRFGAAPFVDAGEVAGKAAEFTPPKRPSGACAETMGIMSPAITVEKKTTQGVALKIHEAVSGMTMPLWKSLR